MATITFIRHARSSWENQNLQDFERPLSERWNLEIKYMRKIIKCLWLKFDIIFVSHALRAQKTFKKLFKRDKKVLDMAQTDEKIYFTFHENHFSLEKCISYLEEKLQKHKNIALVWHDNGFTETIGFLLWEKILEMPTCSIVKIKIDSEKILKWTWKLKLFVHNKKFIDDLVWTEK